MASCPYVRLFAAMIWPCHAFLYFCHLGHVNTLVIRVWCFLRKIKIWKRQWVFFVPPDPYPVFLFAPGSWIWQIISPGYPCSLVSCCIHWREALTAELGWKKWGHNFRWTGWSLSPAIASPSLLVLLLHRCCSFMLYWLPAPAHTWVLCQPQLAFRENLPPPL